MSHRVIVAVFRTTAAAEKAATEIKALQHQKGSDFKLNAGAMVTKDQNGQLTYSKEKDRSLLGIAVGVTSGALIGLLSVPVGFVAAAVGATLGMGHDMAQEAFDSHFIDDVAGQMQPGRVALIFEVHEGETAAVDEVVAQGDGKVFRQAMR